MSDILPKSQADKTGWPWTIKTSPDLYEAGKAYPKISIVTPSFNQGEFLEETIRSVLDQNYPNLEYIIIDGGSTDDSVEIIKKYEKYLTYWVSEPDRGHGHALNKGFELATGEIMAWLNSDDKYLPWTFETVAEVFNAFPEVQWIQGNPASWDVKGRLVSASNNQRNLMDFLIGRYAWIQQESTFWRRSLWHQSGGYINEDYQFMVDGELWSRYFLVAELYRVDMILGGFRHHTQNRSKENYDKCHEEMEAAVKTLRINYNWKGVSKKSFWIMFFLYRMSRKFLIFRIVSKVIFKIFRHVFNKNTFSYKNICIEGDLFLIKKYSYNFFY